MSDIDDFLRRAAERRTRQKRPAIEILEPIDAEIVEAEAVDLSNHVSTYLDSSKFAQRASQLGHRLGLPQDTSQSRLDSKFDHELGTLRRPEEAAKIAEATPSPAGLLDLLRSPETLRQAIVLSEILQPPHHRW